MPATVRTRLAGPRRGQRALAVTASLLTVMALAGCSGSGDEQSPATPTVASTTSAGAATTTASSAPAADVVLTFTIAKGKATPAFAQVDVKAGQTVSITVTSDTADEVHVHGYDKELELSAGTPATVSFTADQTGAFEVETHESGLRLASLVVR